MPSSQLNYQIYQKDDSSAVVLLKIAFLTNFQEKMCSEGKKYIFCFWKLKSVFLLFKAKYQTQVVEEEEKIKRHPHTAKASSCQEHIKLDQGNPQIPHPPVFITRTPQMPRTAKRPTNLKQFSAIFSHIQPYPYIPAVYTNFY